MSGFDTCFDDFFDGGPALGDIVVDPTSVAPTVALAPIDHVAAGLARLPQQWRNKPHMIAMLTIFLQRYNDLEAAFQDLLLLRSIDTANADDPLGTVGAQLDRIGRKVGQQRNGLNNTDYRRYIRAKIATNNSDGLIEDLITIAVLIVNDPAAHIIVTTEAVATVVLEITGLATDNNLAGILADFLRLAVVGGVRYTQITHPSLVGSFTLGDATSTGWPESAVKMTTICAGFGTWSAGWLCEETSSPLIAAFGGTSLPESGTSPTYNVAGPFGDHAVRISVSASGFAAASSTFLDADATTDICGVIVLRTLSTTDTTVLSKIDFVGGPGYTIRVSNTTVSVLVESAGPVTATATVPDAILASNEWFALMFALDRATNTLCVGIQSLATGLSSIGTPISTASIGSLANANAFKICRSGAFSGTTDIAALFMGAGVGAAAGMSPPGNLATALASFCAAISTDPLLGLGDATEGGQPTLTPYGTTGTTGGQLSDARS